MHNGLCYLVYNFIIFFKSKFCLIIHMEVLILKVKKEKHFYDSLLIHILTMCMVIIPCARSNSQIFMNYTDILAHSQKKKKKLFPMLGSLSREIFAIPSIVQRTSIADLLPPHFFLSLFFPNAFHFGRNSTESNISHRNGRTISTFSELIIGSAARVPWGCQSLQIYRDLLVKSTGDVCMKIHVNIQLYTLTICKFPGN